MTDDTAYLQKWFDGGKNMCDLPPGRYWLRGTLAVSESIRPGPGTSITGHGSKGTLIEVTASPVAEP